MNNPSTQIVVFEYHKQKLGLFLEMADPRFGQEMCKMNLGHHVLPEGKEAIKDQGNVKRTGANLQGLPAAKFWTN